MGDKKKLPRGSGPGTDDSITIKGSEGRGDINLPRYPAPKPKPPVQTAIGGIGAIQSAMKRLKGQTPYESESHAYDWRSRNNLKRGTE